MEFISRDQCGSIKQIQAASDNRVRMSSSVTETAAIDRFAEGPAEGRRLSVNDHHHHRSHLQWQTQQKGRVALAGVPSVVASETRFYRSLVRRCADRSQVGNHRRPLHTQVSLIFLQNAIFLWKVTLLFYVKRAEFSFQF